MIPVEPYFLFSIRDQAGFTWKSMICELVDNSFNAGATSVSLKWSGGKVFSISDNGNGAKDLTALINLGKRISQDTDTIGRYGVGAKQALVWLWGTTEILSTTDRQKSHVIANWCDIATSQSEWPVPAVEIGDFQSGTQIVSRSTRNKPNLKALRPAIAATYTPALELGCKISVWDKNVPVLLSPRQWPETTKEIEDTIFAAGRPVQVKMGIVKEGVLNPYVGGFSFERTHRVIKESTLGANGFSVARIAARVKLGHEWHLSTNKDEFYDYHDELADAIQERFHDLMEEADQQAVNIEDNAFNRELASTVLQGVKRREKRNAPDESNSGTVEPQDTGVKRRRASKSTDNPGSISGGRVRMAKGFQIESYYDVDEKVGVYDPDSNRVRLNMTNEWVNEKYKERSHDAMTPLIYGIISEFAVRNENTKIPLLKEPLDDFGSQWGSMILGAVVGKESAK